MVSAETHTEINDPHLDAIHADRLAFLASTPDATETDYDEALKDLRLLHEERKLAAPDFRNYNLPQLPDKDRDDIYDRIVEAERQLVSPDLSVAGYSNGSAVHEDQLLAIPGQSLMVTAEHATDHLRHVKGSTSAKAADYGTGGLAKVIQEDTGAALVMALGRQTGDPNYDSQETAFKAQMRQFIDEGARRHLSLHGMGRTLAASLIDERNFSVMLGIGDNPSDQTMEDVEAIRTVADRYDLRLGVNQSFITFEPNKPTRPKRNPDGSIKHISFAAKGAGTTRAFAQEAAGADPMSAVQIEIADVLRFMPGDFSRHTGEASQRTGIYIGYLFVKDCVELLGSEQIQG